MRRRLRIDVDGSTFVLRGWRGGDLAREAGLKPIWSATAGGWQMDTTRLPDLRAYLDFRNVPADVSGLPEPVSVAPAASAVLAVEEPADVPLFDLGER